MNTHATLHDDTGRPLVRFSYINHTVEIYTYHQGNTYVKTIHEPNMPLWALFDELNETQTQLEEFETPEKTKQELFDEAVLEVLKSKHCKIIRQQLIEMCYSDEEVEQTKQAQDYFSKEEDPDREALRMKYPHSVWVSSGGYSGRSYSYPCLEFNLDKFIYKLLED